MGGGGRVRRNFMIDPSHDRWLNQKKEEDGHDKSFLVRRALKYYRKHGYDQDKVAQAMSSE